MGLLHLPYFYQSEFGKDMEQAMAGEINLTVVGNLTADPELRYTQSGVPVVNLTIASSPRIFDRATNEWKDGTTTFLRCTAWREYAEHIAASLRKGNNVIALGRLAQRDYETKEGEKRVTYELELDHVGPTLAYATAVVTRVSRSSASQSASADAPSADSFLPASV